MAAVTPSSISTRPRIERRTLDSGTRRSALEPKFNLMLKRRDAFQFAVECIAAAFAMVAWVGLGIWLTRGVGNVLHEYPKVALGIIFGLMAVFGFGGLYGFWLIADRLEFVYRGFRVMWISGENWIYEERRSDRTFRRFPFSRRITGNGYNPPCEIPVPNAQQWDEAMPFWAAGRREELLKRIGICFEDGVKPVVTFVESETESVRQP